MAWCFNDEATPFSETLLSRLSSLTDSAVVPALWLYEVVNVTGLAVRKGRITEEKARAFLESCCHFANYLAYSSNARPTAVITASQKA
jgi:predicted nucleic acid-binding protein